MLDELEKEYRRLIDRREDISKEIASLRSRVGENTRRREDRVRELEAEYAKVQPRILDLCQQIQNLEQKQRHTRERRWA